MATPATNAPKSLIDGLTYIKIPAALYSFPELDSLDREIIGCIYSLNQAEVCFISVKKLADLLGRHRTHLSRRISDLVNIGFLIRTDRNSYIGSANYLEVTKKSVGVGGDE